MDVGKLSIPVSVNLGPLQRDLDRLHKQLGRTEKQTRDVTRQMDNMSRTTQSLSRYVRSLGATFAAVFGARAIVSTLADFEASMSKVAAVTRASQPDLLAIRDVVKELGATTEFTASQVAEGFAFLGLAGFNAAQSIEAMPAVLDLATAASMDLGQAADIASNIMSAFGIAAEEATSATDVLAAVNARANTDIHQLGDAMKYVGPIAKALGVSINDTAAAVGTLSDSGIQGSMAGTGLRRVLSSLTNATPKTTKTLKAMGLTLEELNPKTNSLTDIIDRLAKAGITADEAFKIFGDRGAPALLALIENAPKLNRLTKELKNVDGAASEMARTMRDNLQGDLRDFQSAIESVIIAIGESGLTTILRKIVQGLTTFTRFIASQVDRLAAYATAISAMVTGWGAYITVVAAATRATTALSAALVVLKANLVRTGIGALVVLAGELVYWFFQLSERVGGVGNAFQRVGALGVEIWERVKLSGQSLYYGLQSIAYGIQAAFLSAWAAIERGWSNMVLSITKTWNNFASKLPEWAGDWNVDETNIGKFASELELSAEQARKFGKAAEEAGIAANAAAIAPLKAWRELSETMANQSQGGRVRYRSTARPTGDEPPSRTTPPEIDKKAQREAERLRKAYEGLIDNSVAFIRSQELERQAIGMTDLEAAKLRAQFDLLNQARRAGIKLTPEEVESLKALGDAMAEAEYQTRQLQERYDFAKDTFKGFFSDLKNDLQNGASFWEAFGNAAANALQKIADKALDMALNGIFDMIFGAFGGGGTSFAAGILGGTRVGLFANGTSFAPGGWSVVGERGPELLKLPAGSQVQANHRVTAPAQASFGGGQGGGASRVAIDVFVKDDGKIGAIARQEAGSVVEVAIHDYDTNQLPKSVDRVSNYPRIR